MKKGLIKRLSAVVLAAVVAISLAPVIGGLTDGSVGQVQANANTSGDYEYTLIDGKAKITKYNGSATNLLIPSEVDGYKVTAIGERAFFSEEYITSVTIPNTVTSIGSQAFMYCDSLRNITIPGSVTNIGTNAFASCEVLSDVVISEGVVNIGTGAFSSCLNLQNVTLSNSVVTIGESAFSSCSKLQTITIPESVTSIGDYAFSACPLSYVIIPANVTSIGERVFSYCNNLEAIAVDYNNPVYDSRGDCNAIIETKTNKLIAGCKNTLILDSVTSTGVGAFEGIGITHMYLPDSITSLGYCTFSRTDLTSIKIPDGVTTIKWSTFSECKNLTKVTIPRSVTSIEGSVFRQCTSLKSITIPYGVTTLDTNTFLGCSSLKEITIPESVSLINESTFEGCKSLTDIYYVGTEEDWKRVKIKNSTGGNGYFKSATVHYLKRFNFKDIIDRYSFYYEPVYWAVGNGITNGWTESDGTYTFRPWQTCNRAAVVTFLWRMAGSPEPEKIAEFKDMPADTSANQDFRKAISWAVEQGITTGWSDNTFRPWNTCNRAAIMTFIWRYAGEPEAAEASVFTDPTGNADFDAAIAWASENDIATGYADGTFGPWKECNRASVVTFLYRYDNLY